MVTVLTRTIGPSGRDYASFTLAEADVTNIGTSADLVANDEAIVFEADAGLYAEPGTVYLMSSLTTDATRQVTYKPASGAAHGGSESAGVIVRPSTTGTPFDVRDNFTVLDGLVLEGTSAGANGVQIASATAEGAIIRDCIVIAGAYAFTLYGGGSAAYPIRVENCVARCTTANFVVRTLGLSRALYAEIINCTLRDGLYSVSAGANNYDANVDFVNVLALNPSSGTYTAGSGTGTLTVTGSNNFGGSSFPFPVALQGTPYPITASTAYDPGAGDFALYVGKNGALLDSPNNDVIGQGVGPSANSDVPTTDILGNARSGATANPGAFEQPQATATITKTIGPSGRDYTTFTLAEADVTNIGGSADLVNENERIVFEADAGTYSESVTIDNSLTCDPTRNVTFQSATYDLAHISTDNFFGVIKITDGAFTTLRRLQITNTNTGAACRGVEVLPASGDSCEGCTLDGVIATGSNSVNFTAFEVELNASAAAGGAGSAAHPAVIQNCVALGTGGGISIVGGATGDIHAQIVNCTLAGTGLAAISIQTPSDVTVEVVNTINLGHTQTFRTLFTTGALITTGSNNFGSSTYPFPVALQGTPYPITATTNTDPGAGDWAIYETATGTLVFDSDNDVLLGGIGPDSNSDVPTTDIVGNTRSGTTADPGAFQVSPAGIGAFGIETEEAFGSPTLDATITVTAGRGIVSAEAFGTALIAGADLVVTGIASAEVFGRPALEAGTQFRLEFQRDSTVVDVMTHVDAPLTTLTGQDRPIPGMVHTINYYAQHLGWSSDQTAANDEPSPYGGDRITVIVPPPRGDGATP